MESFLYGVAKTVQWTSCSGTARVPIANSISDSRHNKMRLGVEIVMHVKIVTVLDCRHRDPVTFDLLVVMESESEFAETRGADF